MVLFVKGKRMFLIREILACTFNQCSKNGMEILVESGGKTWVGSNGDVKVKVEVSDFLSENKVRETDQIYEEKGWDGIERKGVKRAENDRILK